MGVGLRDPHRCLLFKDTPMWRKKQDGQKVGMSPGVWARLLNPPQANPEVLLLLMTRAWGVAGGGWVGGAGSAFAM